MQKVKMFCEKPIVFAMGKTKQEVTVGDEDGTACVILIRSNANVKGQPNLTAGAFCFWVNDELLPNACLEPGFPRTISVKTA